MTSTAARVPSHVPRRVSVPVLPSGIPDKPFFKIGEAARICAVKPHVLRFWETEFRSLRPQKSRSQQRVYRRKDLEHLLRIRHLLYEERFTIEGARTRLRELGHDEGPALERPPPIIERKSLLELKQGLLELIRLCDEKD